MVDNLGVSTLLRRVRRARLGDDSGFTLIEVLTVMVIMGITFGIAATAFVSYQLQSQHRGTWDELRSTLRGAGERALSEQRTYCVHIGTTTWDVYRDQCSATGTVVASPRAQNGDRVTTIPAFTAPTTAGFPSACPSGDDCVYFYPRGNSSDGSVTVRMDGRADLVIDVEGLTARVSAED